MKEKTANRILVIFDILAAGSIYFLIHEHTILMSAIQNHADQIIFDTGLYYLILASIFPLLRIIQVCIWIFKAKNWETQIGLVLITWFILCLFTANVMPYLVKKHLESAGYHYCGTQETHRVSRGKNTIYTLSKCPLSSG